MKTKKKKLIFTIIKNFFVQLRRDNVNSYAASCAFFFFMSLIPIIILLCALLPFTSVQESDLLALIYKELPETTASLISSIIKEAYNKSVGIISVAAVMSLWSAGKGVNGLILGLNAIEHVYDKRNSLITRILASLYTLVFLGAILVYVLLMIYGRVVKNVIVRHFPAVDNVLSFLVLFRSGITIILMTLVFMILFAFLPYNRPRMKHQLAGAFFTACTWTGFSYFFSLYVERHNAFSLYGSLTTIIILCFWLYFCMYFFFIGANMNKYFRPLIIVLEKNVSKKRNSEKIYKSQPESLEE